MLPVTTKCRIGAAATTRSFSKSRRHPPLFVNRPTDSVGKVVAPILKRDDAALDEHIDVLNQAAARSGLVTALGCYRLPLIRDPQRKLYRLLEVSELHGVGAGVEAHGRSCISIA
jgi:hypothetical protein